MEPPIGERESGVTARVGKEGLSVCVCVMKVYMYVHHDTVYINTNLATVSSECQLQMPSSSYDLSAQKHT